MKTSATASTMTTIDPCTIGMSRVKMASAAIRPTPGRENTTSVITAPFISAPICSPVTVTTGIRPLRSACL